MSGRSSTYWIRCRLNYRGEREWSCVSEWSVNYGNSRLRSDHRRATYYTDEKQAKRWARKYGVECPTEPEAK